MQLSRVSRVASAVAVVAIGLFFSRETRAQVAEFDTSHTLYHEAPFRSKMTVYSPATNLRVSPSDWLDVRAGWEADVVSGASVAVKAGPAYQATHPGADVVTAASVHDFRNVANGGFTLKKDAVQLTSGYSYSTENDYKSHNMNVGAKTELFEHNTQLEINYARNFDKVCDRVQAANDTPARFRALEDSDGCFAGTLERTRHSIGVDSFQGSWSQAWTPVFMTQLVYTAQITNGFQSNPYRSVILAEGLKAQEHEPDNRARQALALRANYFIRPWRAALRLGVRGYYDTWGIKSGTGDVELEKYFGESFRLQGRGRVYRQSGAVFWSDDYSGGDRPLGPRGQYWTGDRELSPMTSVLVGLKAAYAISPSKGRILGMMTNLKFSASADMIQFDYDEYTLGGSTISSARAFIFGLSLSAIF
ncbi:MAG: DUF3570 domain-containing protein [Polyangiaceae bacterium]